MDDRKQIPCGVYTYIYSSYSLIRMKIYEATICGNDINSINYFFKIPKSEVIRYQGVLDYICEGDSGLDFVIETLEVFEFTNFCSDLNIYLPFDVMEIVNDYYGYSEAIRDLKRKVKYALFKRLMHIELLGQFL
jgi:hypothetical protein